MLLAPANRSSVTKPVLEGSRSPLHTALGLWREGENHLYPQLVLGPAEPGRRSGEAGPWCVLEDPVPVDVEGDGNANALHQVLDQQEIGVGLLLLTWTLRILSGISEGICNTMVQSGGEFLYIGVGGR